MGRSYANGPLKRALDLALAASIMTVLSPLAALVAAAVRVGLGSPVLFRQQRPGRDGGPFTILKFRTMTDARDAKGLFLPDAHRLGPLGKLLRAASLDELPELINVLRGEMSLVGPRPLLPQYLPRYDPTQARRHEVPPGVTGWAQVNGRNALSWEQKLELDVWYVDHASFWLDLKIIALTLLHAVRPHGISHPGSATMPEFQGGQTAADEKPGTPSEN